MQARFFLAAVLPKYAQHYYPLNEVLQTGKNTVAQKPRI
jgi:hypothetical protein